MTYRSAVTYPPRARTRRCQLEGCEDEALTAHLYCARHAVTPEGVAFYHEVRAAAAAMRELEDSGPDVSARQEAAERFGKRVRRGKFNGLLDRAMTRIIDEAAENEAFNLELGALRFAITRTLSEESDPHRMSLSIARLANAISRLAVAHYATRDPKPVVRFGEEWTPPLPHGEGLVHYIWRHRPADFEERYMIDVEEPKPYPAYRDKQIEEDHNDNRRQGDGPNEEGRYPPPPLTERRRRALEYKGPTMGDIWREKSG